MKNPQITFKTTVLLEFKGLSTVEKGEKLSKSQIILKNAIKSMVKTIESFMPFIQITYKIETERLTKSSPRAKRK